MQEKRLNKLSIKSPRKNNNLIIYVVRKKVDDLKLQKNSDCPLFMVYSLDSSTAHS